MNNYQGDTADAVWKQAATELINNPEYTHEGRDGKTHEIIPCILRIQDPRHRWILSRFPPYNPAFGLVEFLWILNGQNESRVLNHWNPGLPKYSGDSKYYHGAYGYRLKHEFGFDQIKRAYEVLLNAPETRQAVLQIWKPDIDMPKADGLPISADIPCNITSLLKIRNGRLHWTQIMRSNDIMRGLPYNIIQFTMIQELMAGWLGCEIGEYFHLSDSLHIYNGDLTKFTIKEATSTATDITRFTLTYDESSEVLQDMYKDLQLVADGDLSAEQLSEIFHRDSFSNRSRDESLRNIMSIIGSDAARRQGYHLQAEEFAYSCTDQNLRNAAIAWLMRKKEKL